MKNHITPLLLTSIAATALFAAPESMENLPSNFGEDAAFLKKHTDAIVLRRGDAAVAVVPSYQARVMTSTATGDTGKSYGWLNYKLISKGVVPPEEAKGTLEAKIHVFGGEERFWLGPEGGQFGIFFAPGAAFDFADWKTPAPIDTESFELVSSEETQAVFARKFSVINQSGTKFDLAVERKVRLLDRAETAQALGVDIPENLPFVAYETVNTITNRGEKAWDADSGLLSVWILGMYKPSPSTVMAIPFREECEGPVVNDAYFGKISADRLKVGKGVVFFKGDGASRGKIGIPPSRATPFAGSYSPDLGALTIVRCDPVSKDGRYVNSMWEKQKDPFAGDVINAYNDGSPAPGEPPLGPFYELETSSPAAELAPGASLTHKQITVHFAGAPEQLDAISAAKLGAGIGEIRDAFNPSAR
ncbi:MAG: hypothetical protein RIQ71_47 [Verrucomicrobiota bacterium]|jgi:hypothetical protein